LDGIGNDARRPIKYRTNHHADLPRSSRAAVSPLESVAGHFKEEIIQAFDDGMRHRPETTFGTVKADVLADKDPSFQPENFCRVIRASAWSG
jgi:hypothetical protein